MDEIVKNELLEKIYFLEKEDKYKKKLKENDLINLEVFKVNKELILYLVNNKLENREDIIKLRDVLNSMIKTARVRYSEEEKERRLKMLIEKVS